MILLEIRNLKSHLSTPDGVALAVDGVDLSIGEGEAVGLVGESGSGKTVLALSILGLLPPGSGCILPGSSIRFRGEELVGMGGKRLREIRGGDIAMIFQEPMTSLNPVFSIGSQVREVLEAHRSLDRTSSREEVVRLLGEVGIPDPAERAKAYPHELSGGMRQRAMIAMALAGQPALLVADEPTTALDVTLQAQILDLLGDIQRRFGMALLLVSHDVGVVSRLCQRVVVLYGGEVVEVGPTHEILQEPMHPYTRGLLGSRLSTAGGRRVLTPIPGEVPEATKWPPGCRFHPRCPEAMDRCRTEKPDLLSPFGSDPEGREPPSANLPGTGGPLLAPPRREGWGPVIVGGRELPGDVVTDGDQEVLLSARGVSHSFPTRRREKGRSRGTVQALRGVDLDLLRGECLAVVGESGSGKTTLARALLRLIEPTEGRVVFGGFDVLTMRRDELQAFRRSAQIVFQDPFGSLNPRLRAGPMLEEVLKVHDLGSTARSRKGRAEELLQLVGLHPSHLWRYPHEFSGGQRQRLGIARALSVQPQLLILDEPVSSLDLSVQAQILNLLRELQDRLELTLMLVAHDLSVVRQLADRISVMYLGKIVETSPVDDLFADPRHPYTRGLLVAADLAGAESPESEAWALLPVEPPSPLRPPVGCGFYPRCRHPERDGECTLSSPELTGTALARQVACWKEI